jgi:hypothetical protein
MSDIERLNYAISELGKLNSIINVSIQHLAPIQPRASGNLIEGIELLRQARKKLENARLILK